MYKYLYVAIALKNLGEINAQFYVHYKWDSHLFYSGCHNNVGFHSPDNLVKVGKNA